MAFHLFLFCRRTDSLKGHWQRDLLPGPPDRNALGWVSIAIKENAKGTGENLLRVSGEAKQGPHYGCASTMVEEYEEASQVSQSLPIPVSQGLLLSVSLVTVASFRLLPLGISQLFNHLMQGWNVG